MITVSFMSANYVALANGYDGSHDWGYHDRATQSSMTPEAFESIARNVKDAGFSAIDIWSGHCHFKAHAATELPEQVAQICRDNGLTITSYAGGMPADNADDVERFFSFVKRIGAPLFAGGVGGKLAGSAELPPLVDQVAGAHGLQWAFENHAETSVAQMLARIGGGSSRCGIALDTGWCGTHGLDALAAAKELRPHLMILHLKDVKAIGGHDTCTPGDGIVDCEGVLRYLKESGWSGTVCIEHEPYDHDPTEEAATGLQRARGWLERARG